MHAMGEEKHRRVAAVVGRLDLMPINDADDNLRRWRLRRWRLSSRSSRPGSWRTGPPSARSCRRPSRTPRRSSCRHRPSSLGSRFGPPSRLVRGGALALVQHARDRWMLVPSQIRRHAHERLSAARAWVPPATALRLFASPSLQRGRAWITIHDHGRSHDRDHDLTRTNRWARSILTVTGQKRSSEGGERGEGAQWRHQTLWRVTYVWQYIRASTFALRARISAEYSHAVHFCRSRAAGVRRMRICTASSGMMVSP